MLKFLSIGIIIVFILVIVLFRKKIKPFFRFLGSKLFLINLMLALLALFLIPYFTLRYLDTYTHHGVKLPVPNFIGTEVKQIEQFAADNDVEVVINDSVFSDKFPRGTVIRQDPMPNSKTYPSYVKPHRKIYVTIVKQAGEYKEIPDLTGDYRVSKKIAKVRLEMLGFKTRFERKISENNYVIELQYKNRKLKKGEKILKGETITIVHGSGNGGAPVTLQNVVGKTAENARQLLGLSNLVVDINYEGENITAQDSANFVITLQNPNPNSLPESMVQSGTTIYLIAKKGVPIADTTANE